MPGVGPAERLRLTGLQEAGAVGDPARLLDARVTAIEAELSRKKAEIALATAPGTLLDALP